MINIIEEIKVTKIYLVENCYGDKNKVYIGKEKSHQTHKRENDHRKTFGNQIIFNYIDQCKSWNKENWRPLETFWIQYFKFLGFEVVNIQKEGGSGVEFHTKETRMKIRKSSLGKKKSKEHRLNMSKARLGKPNLGAVGPKTKKHCLNISKAKLGKKQSKTHKQNKAKSLCKPILQYNLQGNLIKEWDSQKEASNKLKINRRSISSCCLGRLKTAGGYIWKLKENNDK